MTDEVPGVAEIVGQLVAEAMRAAGVTQQDVAARLDINQAGVSRRVNGLTAFGVDELALIADLCGIPMAELIPAAA